MLCMLWMWLITASKTDLDSSVQDTWVNHAAENKQAKQGDPDVMKYTMTDGLHHDRRSTNCFGQH